MTGEYAPSPMQVAASQVALYESSGGLQGTTMLGKPVIILTTLGARTGKVRKTPLMRVEHEGKYAAIASLGGAPRHPVWYYNVVAHPQVELQDGPLTHSYRARELTGSERDLWWDRAVSAFGQYADYAAKTTRQIPVFLLERDDPMP